jgi:glycosyltransferase involved in cell wall biosynthesis
MRIGVNCYNLIPQNGGITQYFHNLFGELLPNDRRNEYVFFWFPHNGTELDRLTSERWRDNAILLERQGDIRGRLSGLDIYFCPLNALYPRPLPLPTVVTIADIQETFYPENFTAEVLYSRDRHFVGSTKMADCVITHSEFTKQTLIQKHRLPSDKIAVVPHCSDPIFAADDAASCNQPLPSDFILYPANFWNHKNHDRLLQALGILRSEHGLAIDLALTGFPVPNGSPVQDKAREYGVEALVHVLGYTTAAELSGAYRRARMLVFPSYFEGFGLPLIEAMAAGCPIAAADATSIPEVVGDAAVLFDPMSPPSIADAIARLWRNPDLRRALAERGRRRNALFSPAKMAELHLRAFDQAAGAYTVPRHVWRTVYQPCHMAWAECRRIQRALRSRRARIAKEGA